MNTHERDVLAGIIVLWQMLKNKREIVTIDDWVQAYQNARQELKDYDFNQQVHEALKEFADVGK